MMKTLLLNPPSFPNFDGGASSRWPASREIASFWYPVWLAYPAGLIKNSRLLDAPPHGVTPEETIEIAKQYDFVTLYTSSPGFKNDVKLAEMMKAAKPDLKLAFVDRRPRSPMRRLIHPRRSTLLSEKKSIMPSRNSPRAGASKTYRA
jgi:hypothetical protein